MLEMYLKISLEHSLEHGLKRCLGPRSSTTDRRKRIFNRVLDAAAVPNWADLAMVLRACRGGAADGRVGPPPPRSLVNTLCLGRHGAYGAPVCPGTMRLPPGGCKSLAPQNPRPFGSQIFVPVGFDRGGMARAVLGQCLSDAADPAPRPGLAGLLGRFGGWRNET